MLLQHQHITENIGSRLHKQALGQTVGSHDPPLLHQIRPCFAVIGPRYHPRGQDKSHHPLRLEHRHGAQREDIHVGFVALQVGSDPVV